MLVALHADDLGFSTAVNDGIGDALRRGLLTGASVLANAPETTAGLEAWRRIDDERRGGGLPSATARRPLGDDASRPFDLGVHLNLSQGRPLTGDAFPAPLLDREGRFGGLGTFVRLMLPGANRHAAAVRRELAAQVECVLDHGLRPARLDGHQYCELIPLVGRIVTDLAARHSIAAVRVASEPGVAGTLLRSRGAARAMAGVPGAGAKRLLAAGLRRRARRAGLRHPARFFGSVSAGLVDLAVLERFLAVGKRRGAESIEIGLHPALPQHAGEDPGGPACDDDGWHDPLAATRPLEHASLTGDRLPRLLLAHGARLGRLA